MKLKVIAVGKIKETNIRNLIEDYSEKIIFDSKLEIIEVKDSTIEDEGKKIVQILDNIKANKYVFVLSEEGSQLNSVKMAENLKRLSLEKTIVFIIGGPFGLSQKVKEKANTLLSMSKMTFTHEMSRLFLMEQLYRAISIINNKKYHH